MVVVAVQEPCEGCGSFVVGRPGLPVRPLPGERPVVPLDLPVGLRPIGLRELVDRGAERLVERSPAVAGPVVGQHPVDLLNAVCSEELSLSSPETRCRERLLIRQFLGIGQPGVVIDRGVQEGISRPLAPLRGSVPIAAPAVSVPAAAVGDPSDLLHVDVHHVAGDRVFVPVRDLPQILAGDVQVPQPGDAAAQQNPVNRGRGQDDPELGQLGDQHHRAEFHAPAEPLHQVLDLWVRLLRRPTRTRRPVVQAVIAVLHPAGVPFRERLPGHPGLRGDMTDRAASIDSLTQPPTAFRGQRGVTVSHEGLLGDQVWCLVASHLTRRPSLTPSTETPACHQRPWVQQLGLSYFELDDDVGRNPSTCGTCEPAAAGLHLFDADPQVFPGPGHRLVGVRPGRVVSPGRADVAALAVTAVGDLPVPAYGFPVWPGYAFGGAYRAACCRVSLDSAALALTSAAADAASSRTVAVESVAVALTSSRACWAGSCRFPAISLAVSVRSSTSGWAVSFTACAACCSARLAGSIEDTRSPAPKAISPAAIGEPCALRATAVGASDTVSPMLPATRCPVSAASEALPSTASLTEAAAQRTRPTCRLAMLPGFTLSPRALTFSLSSVRVRSISRRICSGSLLIKRSLSIRVCRADVRGGVAR